MEIPITRFESQDATVIAEDAFTRGTYIVGQSLVINRKTYEVVSVVSRHDNLDGFQKVVVRDATTCFQCGGIKNRVVPPYEDVCLRFASAT